MFSYVCSEMYQMHWEQIRQRVIAKDDAQWFRSDQLGSKSNASDIYVALLTIALNATQIRPA
jgi:hypothetical protein